MEIIPFNEDIFSKPESDWKRLKLNNISYIVPAFVIEKLMSIELPIKNQRIAMNNILEFLTFLDANSDDKDEMVMSYLLIERFFSRNKYKVYLEMLMNLGIIQKIPHNNEVLDFKDPIMSRFNGKKVYYIPNYKATKYRLTKKYTDDEKLCMVIFKERGERKFNNEVKELDSRYVKTIKSLNLDISGAIDAEIRYYKEKGFNFSRLRKRITRILNTNNKRYIKMGVKSDRIYHSFSNISKVARNHFLIKLYDIDIVNSQPLILVAFLKKNKMAFDENYQRDCEEGLFYERFYDLYPNNKDEEEVRKYIKVNLFSSIFFSFKQRREMNKRFKKLYPNTWESLKKIDESGETLASKLQTMEASFFNNLIPEYSDYYFTLFDAIYFNNYADKIILEKRLKEYFNEFNIKVNLK